MIKLFLIFSIIAGSNHVYGNAKKLIDVDTKQHKCLTEVIYYEARGDTKEGKLAVADVVLNRVKHPYFPNTICKVVYQKNQFSWTKSKYKVKDLVSWEKAKEIAKQKIIREHLKVRKDITKGATFFSKGYHFANTVKVAKIGRTHIFFKLHPEFEKKYVKK